MVEGRKLRRCSGLHCTMLICVNDGKPPKPQNYCEVMLLLVAFVCRLRTRRQSPTFGSGSDDCAFHDPRC